MITSPDINQSEEVYRLTINRKLLADSYSKLRALSNRHIPMDEPENIDDARMEFNRLLDDLEKELAQLQSAHPYISISREESGKKMNEIEASIKINKALAADLVVSDIYVRMKELIGAINDLLDALNKEQDLESNESLAKTKPEVVSH